MKRIIMFVMVILGAQICNAGTIYVPGDSATIQAGIDGTTNGDTVLVADGIYTGEGNRDISFGGKSIVVMSENGPEFTIIDCEGTEADNHRGFIFENGETSGSVLEGFTVKNGYINGDGGGILCSSSSPRIINCRLIENECTDDGGGFFCDNGSLPEMTNCQIGLNVSQDGGGGIGCNWSSPNINNCELYNNFAVSAGAILTHYNSDPVFSGCLIINNSASEGRGGLGSYGLHDYPVFQSCTFFGNHSDSAHGCIGVNQKDHSNLSNCIIAFNSGGKAIEGDFPLSCCNIYGNEGGDWIGNISMQYGDDGNISLDPLFCDTANNDCRLRFTSPCGPWINQECGLIGALEADCGEPGELPLALNMVYVPSRGDSSVISPSFEIGWGYYDTAATTQSGFEIEIGTDDDWTSAEMWSSGQIVSSETGVIYSGLPLYDYTDYFLRIRVNDGTNWGFWTYAQFCTHFQNVIYVPGDKPTIQEGIDLALEGDTVLVADGIYTGEGNRDIEFGGKNIILMSENGPEVTIIKGGDGHRAFYLILGEDSTSVIDGFTVTECNLGSALKGSIYCSSSDPTIKNCIISGNSGTYGCIYGLSSNITHINCIFSNNPCPVNPPSFYVSSRLEFINCTFSDNNDAGAAWLIDGSIKLTNCTFKNNSSDQSPGGLYMFSSGASFDNCTFYNNSNIPPQGGGDGGALRGWDCNITITNCTFAKNTADYGSAISIRGELILENSIIAHGTGEYPVYCHSYNIENISCCDIYGNSGGDWIGAINDYAGINGNFSLDPMFCDLIFGNLEIDSLSPCAPYSPLNQCGVLIGSQNVGCGIHKCGDANGDGFVNISDAVYIQNYVFYNGDPPVPYYENGDANCDEICNVSDAVWIINYIFVGGNEPCDTTGDGIPDC